MQDKEKGQATGSRTQKTGGSAGTTGRAGRDQDENARVADTSPGDIRTGAQATAGRVGGPGMEYTAAERGASGLEDVPGMRGRTGTQKGGPSGAQNRSDLPDASTGGRTGAPSEAVTHGRGEEESEEAGMRQTSMMLREAREEGDPEMQMREEDLHTRQRNLGERENALREREQAMGERERGMSERERGMGDRERAMAERESSSAYGESGGRSSTGVTTQERSRTPSR